MYKSIFQKEWTKLRWVLLAYVVVSYFAIFSISMDIYHAFKVHGAVKYWNNVIAYQVFFFDMLKFIPVIGGFALAIFQFLPESLNNRYKLGFHLPISEKKLLLFMLLVGMLIIISVNFLTTIGFYIFISVFFPAEIVNVSVLSTLPWFLAGMIAYLGTATTVTEPNWFQRIVLGIMTYFSMNLLLREESFSQYTPVLGYYILIILIYTITILFPGHRLRKGSK